MVGRRPAPLFSVTPDLRPAPDGQSLAPLGVAEERPHEWLLRPAPHPFGERLYRLFAVLIGPLLAWYMFFDKAGAYVHIPGTPLYLAECLLLVAITASILATGYLRLTIRDDPTIDPSGILHPVGARAHASRDSKVRGEQHSRRSSLVLLAFRHLHRRSESGHARRRDEDGEGFSRLLPWLLVWLPVALDSPSGAHHPPQSAVLPHQHPCPSSNQYCGRGTGGTGLPLACPDPGRPERTPRRPECHCPYRHRPRRDPEPWGVPRSSSRYHRRARLWFRPSPGPMGTQGARTDRDQRRTCPSFRPCPCPLEGERERRGNLVQCR